MSGLVSSAQSAGSPLGLAGRIVALAAGYALAGRVAQGLVLPPASPADAVWPAAGVALGGLLCWGWRVLPGVPIGVLALQLASPTLPSGPFLLILIVAATLQASLGAYLVRRFVGFPAALDQDRDAILFLVLAGPVACTVGATLSCAGLMLLGTLNPSEVAFQWLTWWVGDAIGTLTVAPVLMMWLGEPAEAWRRRRVSLAPPLLVALALVTALFVRTGQGERDRAEAALRRRADAVTSALGARFTHYKDVLQSVADFCYTPQHLDRESFGIFVAGALARNPDLDGLGWAKASGTPSSYPVQVLESRQVASDAAVGTDIGATSAARAALEGAVASSRIAVMDQVPWRLGEDALLLASPIAPREGGGGTGHEGFAIATVGLAPFVSAALAGVDGTGLTVGLSRNGREIVRHGAVASGPEIVSRLDLGGHLLTLRISAPLRVGIEPWGPVLGVGLLFIMLLEAVLLVMTGRATRVERLVTQRTRELELSNRAVEEQRGELALSNAQLEAALRGKEVLLRELQHRVKNNLQVIASLFSLQARYVPESRYRDILEEGRNRVMSIALAHENLYRSKDLSRIDFADYVRNLVSHLQAAFGSGVCAVVETELDPITVPVDVAIPCGLIVNELVTNAFKHAFPAGRAGTIRVCLHNREGHCLLAVSDDGVGMPPGVDLGKTDSLGLDLVSILSGQIGGDLRLTRAPGTTFELSFRGDG